MTSQATCRPLRLSVVPPSPPSSCPWVLSTMATFNFIVPQRVVHQTLVDTNRSYLISHYSPKCLVGEFCEVRAATTTALPNGASLFALFFVRLQDHRRAVPKSKCVG